MSKSSWGKFFLLLLGISILMTWIDVNAASNEISFKAMPIPKALQIISERYEVVIIVDPTLQGLVQQTVDTSWPIESVLKKVLDPLGLSFNRIDGYYLINGKSSPLTVFVEWNSQKIPVGFLTKDLEAKLAEFQPYLNYDANSGIVFVKAPSSEINKILEKVWEICTQPGQTTIVYSFQIVDLINSKDLDLLFSGTYANDAPDNRKMVITPEKLTMSQGQREMIFSAIDQKSQEYQERQPWVSVLPGKTVKLKSLSHYAGDEPEEDQRFSLTITPTSLNQENGRVVSEINIEGSERKSASYSSTVQTSPGVPEVLAVVRQVNIKTQNRFFGRRRFREVRNFALILTAIPLKIQKSFAVNDPHTIPLAVLEGFDRMNPTEGKESLKEQNIECLIGLTFDKSEQIDPWFNFKYPMSRSELFLNYEQQDYYEAGLRWRPFSDDGGWVEFKAGEGMGSSNQSLLMLGFGDETRPFRGMSLFATYFPLTYQLDSNQTMDENIWEAGASFGLKPLKLSVSALGNSDYDGYKLRINIRGKRQSWVLGLNNIDDFNYYNLGLSFEL